jgi:hypothetical protein
MVMTVPPLFRTVAKNRGKGNGKFWEEWNQLGETLNRKEAVVRVLAFGWTSEKQLAYEEKVLQDIVTETGGVASVGKPVDESQFVSADAVCSWFIGGRFLSEVYFESLDCGLQTGRAACEIANRRTPPLAPSWDLPGWFVGIELAHMSKEETLNYVDVAELDALRAHEQDCRESDIKIGGYAIMEDTRMFGKHWQNYDQKMKELKAIFDPNSLSNPPKPLERTLFEPKV